jgi:hypothetical protein
VKGYDIGGSEKFFMGDESYAQILCPLFGNERVAANDFALEGLETGGNTSTYFAEPDYTRYLALEFGTG